MTQLSGYGPGATPEQVKEIVSEAVGGLKEHIDQRLDDLQDQVANLSVALVRAGLIEIELPPEAVIRAKALLEAAGWKDGLRW